jgi:cell division protein FtsI/penicillin-binding protein 2
MRRVEDKGQPIGHRLLEGAMVRMAAVAVIDVASGRIEALAGAMSPCARQEVDGPGRELNCDKRLPYPVRYRPDALLNPAVFHDAMPASTIKPIMAAAFLTDADVGPRWLSAERAAMKKPVQPAPDSLRGQLMRSDSARFLDRMFCSEKNFSHCQRPWEVQAMAAAFGWNNGCVLARADCGKQDLLFGRAVDATAESGAIRPVSTTVAYGRLLSEPVGGRLGAPLHLTPPAQLDPAIVRHCSLGAAGRMRSDDDWEKCRGGAVVDVVAEGWGQGHARSSALGIAGMMATLAAAANGQAEVRRPHLVEALRGVGDREHATLASAVLRWDLAAAQPNRVPHDAAEVILSGLSYSHRAGTARTACEQVFDAKACRGIEWLAGKTGTPSFPSDGLTLNQLLTLCGRAGDAQRSKEAACGSLRPYKWYVAAYRDGARSSGPWTKAIAVLTERNWTVQGGHIHGAGDHGPNPSAEIAMQITARQLGLIPGTTP